MNTEALKPRSARLLRILLETDKPITVDDLAKRFSVSSRTIRYDLASARRWVSGRGMNIVVRPRVGIKLTGNPEQVQKDLGEAQKPSYQVPLLVADRRNAILLALLQTRQPLSLGALADLLFVSRSTVKSDVAVLKRELKDRPVAVKHRPGVGHYVQGDEAAIRKLMADLYFEKTQKGGMEMVAWADLLPDAELLTQAQADAAWQVAGSFRIETRLCLDPNTFGRLVAMLLVSMRRVTLGYEVAIPSDQMSRIAETLEYSAVSRLGDRIREVADIELHAGDLALITVSLMRMGQSFEGEYASSEDRAIASEYATRLIAELEVRLAVELANDEELFSGLRTHIARVLRLLRLGIVTPNALLEDIRRQYPKTFEACSEANRIVGSRFGVETGQDEAGYLSMHVGAAMERKKRKPTRVLVCTNGVSSAKLLSARLARHFKDIEIMGAVPASQLMEYSELDRVDIIVSSVPFRAPRAMVVVNPLLNGEDIAALESCGLMRFRHARLGDASMVKLVRSITQGVARHADIRDVHGLQESISQALRASQEIFEDEAKDETSDAVSAASLSDDRLEKTVPPSVVEVGLLVSRDLALDTEETSVLKRLLLAAHEGALRVGLTLQKGVLFDLALHLASTVIFCEESGPMREMAFHAALELTPEMVSAGKEMARLMAGVLGRPMEDWEETYLAVYAGASLLRKEGIEETDASFPHAPLE